MIWEEWFSFFIGSELWIFEPAENFPAVFCRTASGLGVSSLYLYFCTAKTDNFGCTNVPEKRTGFQVYLTQASVCCTAAAVDFSVDAIEWVRVRESNCDFASTFTLPTSYSLTIHHRILLLLVNLSSPPSKVNFEDHHFSLVCCCSCWQCWKQLVGHHPSIS